jgi:hypothetical protein
MDTLSRFDKYDGRVGGFRAPLNAAWNATSGPTAATDLDRVTAVALNGSGRIIRATTALMCVGIIVVNHAMAAGDIIDVMTSGEIVELAAADLQAATAPVAGTKYYVDVTAGRLVANAAPTAGTNYFYVGTTVEATRLVVRTGLVQGGA